MEMANSLRDSVNAELKHAIRAQDKRRMSTLRLITAAFKDRDIQSRGTGRDDAPTEDDLKGILSKMVKQRKDSAATYDEAGRPDLAQGEREEIAIVEEFLPKQLSEQETRVAVKEVMAELRCEGLKDMGRAMGRLKERYAGQMDFSKACAMVKEELRH